MSSSSTAGSTVKTIHADEQIARGARLRPIGEVASGIGLQANELETYGSHVAKVSLGVLDRLANGSNGHYVHVTSMTPMPGWEDPTVTAIALSDALAKMGKKSACCLQQPSLAWVLTGGPIRAGSGQCQVVPREQFALGLTGDLYAVAAAHALMSSLVDVALVRSGPDGLDPRRITLRRCQEVADTALRQAVVGLGGGGVPRESGFDSPPSSEVMASFTLAGSLKDLRRRLGQMVVGYNQHELPVAAESMRAAGAMTALLRDAFRPNLMQTLNGTPVFVHGATSIDFSHGGSSIVADRIALKCCDYVVTVSLGGAELGLEKFCDIKCRASGLTPGVAVLIATTRGVKFQSGRYRGYNDPKMAEPSVPSIKEGAANLAKHLENVRYFGLPCIVVIHRTDTDTAEELQCLEGISNSSGAVSTIVSSHRETGVEATMDVARAVMAACEAKASRFSFLYDNTWPIAKKIETIATTLYNAGRVNYSPKAAAAVERYTQLGWSELSVCMAKTVYSLSHSPQLLGRPYDFILPVEDVRVCAGAGYLVVRLGAVQPMSALARRPRAMDIDVTDDGEVRGLFD